MKIRKKLLISFLTLIGMAVVAILICIILNFKTISLVFTKGDFNIYNYDKMVKIAQSRKDIFNPVEQAIEPTKKQAKFTSKNKAINYMITLDKKTGKLNANGVVQVTNVSLNGVSIDKTIGVSEMGVIIKEAENLLSPVLPKESIAGLSACVAKDLMASYKSGAKKVSISEKFKDCTIDATVDFVTGAVSFDIGKIQNKQGDD